MATHASEILVPVTLRMWSDFPRVCSGCEEPLPAGADGAAKPHSVLDCLKALRERIARQEPSE